MAVIPLAEGVEVLLVGLVASAVTVVAHVAVAETSETALVNDRGALPNVMMMTQDPVVALREMKR